MSKKTYSFQTEVNQLLQLMIHSLYSNKEIFLRELISNSSDALDKLRFEATKNEKLQGTDKELKISIGFDEKAKTIFIQDNGIGMTHDEVIENIGTIANSGTKKFLEKLTGDASKDNNLIGQFGVGFYSSFMVAEQVSLITKKAGEDKVLLWQSKGDGSFSLEEIKDDNFNQGTKIVLQLNEENQNLLSAWELKNLVSKYSDNISFPIMMQEEEEIAEPEDTTDKAEADGKDESIDDKETKETKTKTQLVWKQINKAKALWTLSKSDISEEEYKEFYKAISHDYTDPLTHMHNKVEGTLEYNSLLYIPKKAPFDLWDRNRKYGLKLYVKRVFIMDNAEDLLPGYLRFVKGIIDSSDLPLNVSREILQSNKMISKIKAATVKRVLDYLAKLAKSTKEEDITKFKEFYANFGKVIKEGVVEDIENKEKIAKILKFAHLDGDSQQNYSLDEYIKNFKKDQNDIYFITSENYNQAVGSPHLEIFKDKKIDVLLLTDPVDEWVVEHLNEFDGKKLISVTQAEIEGITSDKESTDKDNKQDEEKQTDENQAIIDKIKKALTDQASEVKISKRLTSSPSCIVEDGMNSQMMRMMAQMGQEMPMSKPVLEINPKHEILQKISKLTDETEVTNWSKYILYQAQLSKAGKLDNPSEFVELANKLIKI